MPKLILHKSTQVALYQSEDDSKSLSAIGPLGPQCHLGTGVDLKAATGGLYTID